MDQVAAQGWDAYRVVFVTIAVALAVPVFLHFLTKIAGILPKDHGAAAEAPRKDPEVPSGRAVNTRYFTAAQVGGMVSLPFVLLVPLAEPGGPASALSVLSVAIFCGAALVYANRKGDLHWHEQVREIANDRTRLESGEEAP